mmetsp:Transcript_24604/g.93004  ORF Transcript_24604/g.93004 Transcript_24604/m.93004 type:complete len:467 (+) Transcript_24604:6151-7551(+)
MHLAGPAALPLLRALDPELVRGAQGAVSHVLVPGARSRRGGNQRVCHDGGAAGRVPVGAGAGGRRGRRGGRQPARRAAALGCGRRGHPRHQDHRLSSAVRVRGADHSRPVRGPGGVQLERPGRAPRRVGLVHQGHARSGVAPRHAHRRPLLRRGGPCRGRQPPAGVPARPRVAPGRRSGHQGGRRPAAADRVRRAGPGRAWRRRLGRASAGPRPHPRGCAVRPRRVRAHAARRQVARCPRRPAPLWPQAPSHAAAQGGAPPDRLLLQQHPARHIRIQGLSGSGGHHAGALRRCSGGGAPQRLLGAGHQRAGVGRELHAGREGKAQAGGAPPRRGGLQGGHRRGPARRHRREVLPGPARVGPAAPWRAAGWCLHVGARRRRGLGSGGHCLAGVPRRCGAQRRRRRALSAARVDGGRGSRVRRARRQDHAAGGHGGAPARAKHHALQAGAAEGSRRGRLPRGPVRVRP